jgi:hypothetical protein
MQRSIINYQPIIPFVLLVGLILFESINSLYVYITPLAGFIFLYIVENFHDKDKKWIILSLFIYLTYFELDKGFFVLSSLILFIIYYKFFHEELEATIACDNCLRITIIFIYYFSFYILNLLFALIFNYELPKVDIAYIVFLISDIVMVLL